MTDSTATDAAPVLPGRRSPVRRKLLVAVGLLLVALGGLVLDAALVAGRLDRVAVELPDGPGETWVLIGEDSRAELPAGASVEAFGTVQQAPGSRADVIVVVHSDGDRTTAFSIPRDLVAARAHVPGRLALSWLDGPQSTVDALCGLGIAADHLVAVDLAGFAAVVDSVGGLEVDVPVPVRDPVAGLALESAGRLRVDGDTALALVRSRQPEHLVDGRWTPAPADAGGRATAAADVLGALTESARGAVWQPWRLQALAWTGSGAMTVDQQTSAVGLLTLLRTDLDQLTVLPAGDPVGGTLARFPTDGTAEALDAAGMSCGG